MFAVYDSFRQVSAYLDPGTGSIIIMVLMGALAGGMIIVKTFWDRVKTFVKSLFRKRHD